MIPSLKNSIDAALADEVELREVDQGLTQVYVPFEFPDGDGLVLYVRHISPNSLQLTDRGHTLMHMAYHTDVARLAEGQRASLLEQIRLRHDVDEHDGEFVMPSSLETVGSDVFRFSQALLEIADLRNLDREVVRSTFREDFTSLLTDRFPQAIRNFVDREHDERGDYPVPFVLNNTARPIGVFDINSDERALEAVVIANKMREWGHKMHVVAVEEDQETLTRKHVAWLSAALDKQFPALQGRESAIVDYLTEQHALSRRLGPAPDAS